MAAYYNENDRFAAAWLRELIKAGLIADGEVNERSIDDVRPADLRGFVQCHFFAGIGGWSHALRLAGWDDSRAVWTGSCPCQPWSVAGSGEGTDDPRHLWPTWFRLIEECRPSTIFGEQVASLDGRYWLDLVYVDMEACHYALGAADLCAACVGAPHRRQRIFWVADTDGAGLAGSSQVISLASPGREALWWRAITQALSDDSLATWRGGCEPQPQPMLRSGDDGLSARVGRLRGYGNAIVPQCAQAFIEAYRDATEG